MQPTPTIIDTDIGDDVDDAFALALALRSPELDVVGVTTVAGPVERRARLAQTLLLAAGRADIAVAAGSSAMSSGHPGSPRFSHAPVVAPDSTLPPLFAGNAVALIQTRDARRETRDMRRESFSHSASSPIAHCPSPIAHRPLPEITIICLGPLTNVALALQADPTLAQRVRIVAMGGKLGLPYPDWNLRCDPAAARTVLRSSAPVTLVGMHVTMATKLSRKDMHQLFAAQTPLSDLLARCVLAWRTPQRRMPILHDALTVAVACDPSIVKLTRRHVLVGAYGFSFTLPFLQPNAFICTSVSIPHWNAIFVDRLLQS